MKLFTSDLLSLVVVVLYGLIMLGLGMAVAYHPLLALCVGLILLYIAVFWMLYDN